MTKISFKVNSFRKIPNPYLGEEDSSFNRVNTYIAIVDVKDIPDNIPKGTNPREQKLSTGVAKSIEYSLLKPNEDNFLLLNRGILVSSSTAVYNPATSIVTLDFLDEEVHGNIDGGHTYEIIKNNKQNLRHNEQYVKLEIVTGTEDFFQDLARARNTSTQVKDKSIVELESKFDIVKNSLSKDILSNISFKENEQGNIDIVDFLATLNLFDLNKYPNGQYSNFPIVSYSGKANCIKYYLKYYKDKGDTVENPYVQMRPMIEDILRLYDYIETRIDSYYKESQGKGSKYGSIKGIIGRSSKTSYFENDTNYQTPKSFILPILSSLRALVSIDSDSMKYKWNENPYEFLDENGSELVEIMINSHRELGNNPNSTGKSKNLWNTLYMTTTMKSLG
ncbi:AIPR family protein [Erysipelothrix sp. D19-032]